MQLQPLTAISPIDGRYRSQLQHLDAYFSEFALIKYRVKVELEYFLFLSEKKFFKVSALLKKQLLNIEKDFFNRRCRKNKSNRKNYQPRCKSGRIFSEGKIKRGKSRKFTGMDSFWLDFTGY